MVLTSVQAARALQHKAYGRAQVVVFAGMSDQGKTTTMRDYIEAREPRLLMLDPFDKDFPSIRRRLDFEDALSDLAEGGPCRRRVVPPFGEDTLVYAERVFEACVRELRDCLLGLDEITIWTEPNASRALQTLALQGRRRGIRILLATQMLALVPRVLMAQATELVLFKMVRPADLDTVAEWTDKETAQRCAELEQGQCILRRL